MSKLLKILAALSLLVVGVLVAATLLFDPNDYKDDIQARFEAATGRELIINGNLQISLLPRPALEAAQVSLPGASGFEDSALATLGVVRFYPRIAPLFAGRFELDLIQAEGVDLQLIRDPKGRASWDVGEVHPGFSAAVLAAMLNPTGGSSASQGPFDVQAAEVRPVPDGLVIGGIEILDARVVFEDHGSGRRFELDDVEAFVGPILPHEPVPLRMTGTLLKEAGDRYAGLRAEGSISAEEGLQRLRLEPLVLELEGVDLGLGLTASFLLHAELGADLQAQTYLADAAALEIRASSESLSGRPIEARAEARVELDLGAESLQVSGLSIRSGVLSAHGAASGQTLLSTPVLTGDLTVDELDLRAWLEQQGLPLPRMAEAETFRRFALASDWRAVAGQLDLRNLVLRIDETEIKGKVGRTAAASPAYRFDFVADRLDLDRYLPPEGSSQAAPATSLRQRVPVPDAFFVKTAVASAPPPDPAAPPTVLASAATLDVEGRLRFGELRLARILFGDADLKIQSKNGGLDVDSRVRRFYGGRLAGRVGLRVHGGEPKVTLTQHGQGFQTGPLLADLIGQDRVAGRGEITADLTASGPTAAALRQSLAGNLALHVIEGTIKGVDLKRFAAEMQPLLQGQKLSQGLPKQIDFADLRASAKVRRGVLSNQDLVLAASHMSVTGAGTLDLVQEHIDYLFECTFVKPPAGQGRGIKELEGVPIPVRLKGPLGHPQWDVDLRRALSSAAENRLQSQGDGLFKKLEERTGIKGLEQGLKGLLGR